MAGFHPAAGRVSIGQDHANGGGGGVNNQHEKTNDYDDDEVESDFSDWDRPYHETASNWYHRHLRRRARRLAGISSSSSSSSSEDCNSLESGDDDNVFGNGNDDNGGHRARSKRRKEMEKAVRSANRPLTKWLASYPLIAARCCLSSVPSTMHTMATNANDNNGKSQLDCYGSSLPPRDRETKQLRRIFRRLSRKQKEFHVKFTEKNSSSGQTNTSSYYQTSNAMTTLEQMTRINQDGGTSGSSDQLAIHSFLPQGTGISFIDAVLARDSLLRCKPASGNSTKEQQTSSRLVLELNGPPRSGMTSILLAVAARYVASTSKMFLGTGFANDSHDQYRGGSPGGCPRPTKRRKQNDNHTSSSVTEPRVVILDLEKGIHPVKLILAIREAVLRRWDETAAAREWKRDQTKLWNLDGAGEAVSDKYVDKSNDTVEEQDQINLAITSCLGRIHVVQPRDFTYLSLVATVEVLRQSLDEERALKNPTAEAKKQPCSQFGHPHKHDKHPFSNVDKQQEPPTLILIDSLSTLDESTRFQESLPTTSGSNYSSGGSGLSDRNEFYRQLTRLREDHETAIIAASRFVPSMNNKANDQAARGVPGGKRGGNSLFDKMVSHRISLHHVVEGTSEDRVGYDFVATLNAKNNQEGARIFPYTVAAGGISC